MSTQSKPPKATEKDVARDLAAHAQLPLKTKQLMELKDHVEKSTDRDQGTVTKEMKDTPRKARRT